LEADFGMTVRIQNLHNKVHFFFLAPFLVYKESAKTQEITPIEL
jgi:hypothetical protein